MEAVEEQRGLLNRVVHFFVVNQDPRTQDWFLSGSFFPLATILVTYLYFCLYAGPRWMKNRKPFELKNTLVVYNAIQVVFSVYLVHEGMEAGWRKHYNFTCQLVDYTNDSRALRVSHILVGLLVQYLGAFYKIRNANILIFKPFPLLILVEDLKKIVKVNHLVIRFSQFTEPLRH